MQWLEPVLGLWRRLSKVSPAQEESAESSEDTQKRRRDSNDTSAEQLSPLDFTLTLLLALCGYLYLLLPLLLSVSLLWSGLDTAGDAEGMQWLLVGILMLAGLLSAGVTLLLYGTTILPATREPLLAAEQARELYELLGQYRDEFHLPVVSNILLSDQCDIGLIRRPTFFLPVWHRYDLHIGLPLMQLLSQEQFKTLLLREFGHLRWNNALICWLFHLRTIWPLYAGLSPGRWRFRRYLLVLFFGRFAPLYNRISLPLARAEQRAADRNTLRMVSDLDLVEGLAAQVVGENYLQRRYWPRYLALANRSIKPPFLPYSKLEHYARRELGERECSRWLRRVYHAELDERQAQPSLRDRLINIGHISPPPNIELVRISAAEHYLGEHRDALIEAVDQLWLIHNHEVWKGLYEKGLEERRELQTLQRTLREKGELSPNEGWRFATLIERHLGLEKAIPYYKRLLRQSGEDARLTFNIGRILYVAKDPATVKVLERAMLLDGRYNDAATQLITRFKNVVK